MDKRSVVGAIVITLAMGICIDALAVSNRISSIHIRQRAGSTIVEIVGEHAPNFTTFKQSSPQRVIVDIAECQLGAIPHQIQGDGRLIQSVRITETKQLPQSMARIVISLSQEVEYRVTTQGGSLLVHLAPGAGGLLVSAGVPIAPASQRVLNNQEANRTSSTRNEQELQLPMELTPDTEADLEYSRQIAKTDASHNLFDATLKPETPKAIENRTTQQPEPTTLAEMQPTRVEAEAHKLRPTKAKPKKANTAKLDSPKPIVATAKPKKANTAKLDSPKPIVATAKPKKANTAKLDSPKPIVATAKPKKANTAKLDSPKPIVATANAKKTNVAKLASPSPNELKARPSSPAKAKHDSPKFNRNQGRSANAALLKNALLKVVQDVFSRTTSVPKQPAKPGSIKLDASKPTDSDKQPPSTRNTIELNSPTTTLAKVDSDFEPFESPTNDSVAPEEEELVITLDDSGSDDNNQSEKVTVTKSPLAVATQEAPSEQATAEQATNSKAITEVLLSEVHPAVAKPIPAPEPILVASAGDIVSSRTDVAPASVNKLPDNNDPPAATLVAQEEKEDEEENDQDEQEQESQENSANLPAKAARDSDIPERVEVTGGPKVMTWVGFQQTMDSSRVFVKTNGRVRYHVTEEGDNLVVLELENTRIPARNNQRFLDTHFFRTAVTMITPREIEGASRNVRIEIQLRNRVPYSAGQDSNMVYLDFKKP